MATKAPEFTENNAAILNRAPPRSMPLLAMGCDDNFSDIYFSLIFKLLIDVINKLAPTSTNSKFNDPAHKYLAKSLFENNNTKMNIFLKSVAKKCFNLSLIALILLSSVATAMPLETSLPNKTQEHSSTHHAMADEMSEHYADMAEKKCHEKSYCCTDNATASHPCNHDNDCTQNLHCGQTYHAQYAIIAPLLSQTYTANLPPRFTSLEGKPLRTISPELKPPRQ